jgi:hypothetical protein
MNDEIDNLNVPEHEKFALRDWARVERPSMFRRLLEAAESWGTAFAEDAAIEAVVAALRRRGWTLSQRGDSGSYYGRGPNGEDTRVANHLGYATHEVEIVIDCPMTRMRVWRMVAEELAGCEPR